MLMGRQDWKYLVKIGSLSILGLLGSLSNCMVDHRLRSSGSRCVGTPSWLREVDMLLWTRV